MSKDTVKKNINKEMENSFLDYAMSVIVSRALPDVRDGLKPVHRRILYAMNELNNTPDKPYKKSARIVGDVIGKYHPHGDSSVYEAMVRMAQDFSYRNELVDGHGNFGSLDGDGAAAMRYTEARMSKIAVELLKDINKDTIDFIENYDGSETEPAVLPAKFPNLLVNGASGIAVGMATNIPPHNLEEIIDGSIAILDNQDITIDELGEIIKGPDFPLGAQILGNAGIKKAYQTGNGSIKIRSKYEIVEQSNGKPMIVFTEIPFQVNKALIVERIADNVRNKVIEGITDIRDESDRDGIRVVVELRRDVAPEVIVNNLFKHTQLEVSFSINMLALVDGQPKVLNIKEILDNYLKHQKIVIRRKTKFELNKAEVRAHILEGLKRAVDNIDRVIEIIRGSKNTEEARQNLMKEFEFTIEQTKAILEMKLQKLTGLEREKIEEELAELLKLIEHLRAILLDEKLVNKIIKEQLEDIKERFGTPRRTEIVYGYIESDSDYESLIEEKNVLITLTKSGYIKRMDSDMLRTQNRGGKGTKGMTLNEEDEVNKIVYASTHSDLLFFTNNGKVFKTRGYKIPNFASKNVKGMPLINLIGIEKGDKITSIISISEYEENKSLFLTTKKGTGKKTKLEEYFRINKNGKRAITLGEEDEVIGVNVVSDSDIVFFGTRDGNSLKAQATQFRNIGRTSKGVRAIKFKNETDILAGFLVARETEIVLTVTEFGYAKMTKLEEYREQSRGGKGSKNLKVTEKTGKVVDVLSFNPEDIDKYDIVMLTTGGQSIRTKANSLRFLGRNTQGVKIMNLSEGEFITAAQLMETSEEKTEDENE